MIWTLGFLHRLIAIAELTVFPVAMVAVWLLSVATGMNVAAIGAEKLLVISVISAFLHSYLSWSRNIYRVERYRRFSFQVADPTVSAAFALSGSLLISYVLMEGAILHWFYLWGPAVVLLLLILRAIVSVYLKGAERSGRFCRNVGIVGDQDHVAEIVQLLNDGDLDAYFKIVGVSSYNDEMTGSEDKFFRTEEQLEIIASKDDLHILVIALPLSESTKIYEIIHRFSRYATDIITPFHNKIVSTDGSQFSMIGKYQFIQLMKRPLRGSDVIVKAIEDRIVASVALVLLCPIYLIICLVVRLDSPGPVLFKQKRLGFNGQTFTMLKFRTMVYDPADDGTAGTVWKDPRVTRTGAFLRRTSLDELPQLINVLRGEMSVVGPRAHVPGMRVADQRYDDAVREYASRLRVKPGITGWAQINKMRGIIQNRSKAVKVVDLDLYYIENWSLWFDIRIMLRTITCGLLGRDVF